MVVNRRRALQLTGASIAGILLTGCLSTPDPSSVGEEDDDPDDDENSPAEDDGGLGEESDMDDLLIDGRLQNDATEAKLFEITIWDENDEHVATDEWEIEAEETVSVPAFGAPGESRTFEVTVDGVTETASLEFDVESTPGETDGYVDITYLEAETIEIAFIPTDEGDIEGDLPRVDEPPYEITEPECGDEADRDPLWLCENMEAEPTLAFDQVETSSPIFEDEGLAFDEKGEGDAQFYATMLTDEDDLSRLAENAGGAPVELIEETDFDAEAVLIVQTGWGSGSETPHLKRVEETDAGIHAFGCHRQPCIWTDDYTMRTVVARFERPASVDEGFVSLTVAPEIRVNVAVGEGVVTVTDEW